MLALLAGAAVAAQEPPATVEVTIGAAPLLTDLPRIGLNLGHRTFWGAEQLARNVLKNPGLEGLIDRALVRVAATGPDRFSDDTTWLARPDGFWAGAGFEVLTGAVAGATGVILESQARDADGLPGFLTDGGDPALTAQLAVGDMIALTQVRDGLPPVGWWLPDAGSGQVRVDRDHQAPGSPGRRALLLRPLPGKTLRLASHLDTIGGRAGALLPVNGDWAVSLWLWVQPGPASSQPAKVRLLFRRHGTPPFLDLTVTPKPGWQRVQRRFQGDDRGGTEPLEFAVEVSGSPVAVDDLWLGAVGDLPAGADPANDAPGASAFRPEVITALKRLNPGYLREWQGQLGDDLDNRLAVPFARRTSRYRTGTDGDFGYGLPEFLALCRAVDTRPWLILPTTFSPEEASRLGAWLASEAAGFPEVLIEFGNENWNGIFRPAGIQDNTRHAAAADRLFAALRKGARGRVNLRFVVNAQHANPWAAGRIASASREANLVAVAPYLLPELKAADQPRAMDLLFAGDDGKLAEIAGLLPANRELAVYEVNLHTTRGDAPAADRNALVTGAAAGAALAKRLLEAQALGARRQCVYTLSGFDTPLDGQSGLVPLFGIMRDLTDGKRLRPTGWALAMLNQVVGGDLHPVTQSGADGVLVAPFLGPAGWSVALVSAAATPRTVILAFPEDGGLRPADGLVLAAGAALNNEHKEQVYPRSLAVEPVAASGDPAARNHLRVTLPAHGLAVLAPAGKLNP